MNWFTSIRDIASTSFNTICDTVSTIGKNVAAFAHQIKPVLGPLLTTLATVMPHPVVRAVATCANALLHALSLFHPDETVDGMGERALHAAEQGITLDQFEDFDDYMEALRNFDLDPELSSKYNDAEKLAAGLGLATAALADKFNAQPENFYDIWSLPLSNPEYFTAERLKTLMENGKDFGDVRAYLEKRMSGEQASQFEKNLAITPDGTPMTGSDLDVLHNALDDACAGWDKLKQEIGTSN